MTRFRLDNKHLPQMGMIANESGETSPNVPREEMFSTKVVIPFIPDATLHFLV